MVYVLVISLLSIQLKKERAHIHLWMEFREKFERSIQKSTFAANYSKLLAPRKCTQVDGFDGNNNKNQGQLNDICAHCTTHVNTFSQLTAAAAAACYSQYYMDIYSEN